MDSDALVNYQIEEGRKLLLRLAEANTEVTVAAWAQRAEDNRWVLIIALPLVDQRGFATGITEVLRVFRQREQVWIASDDLSVIGATHPTATVLLKVREHLPGRFLFGRFKPTSLSGVPVREVYVYPERLETKLSDAQQQLLADLYARSPLTVDDLPYTDEMERIHHDFVQQAGVAVPIGDLFKALLNLRKRSRLVPASHPVPTDVAANSPTEPV